MKRFLFLITVLLSFGWTSPSLAAVELHFHSFDGSLFSGRYPHTFIVLEGKLDKSGRVVDENYGFSAKEVTTAILSGPVEHIVMKETDKAIARTNRHFSVTLTDEQYWQIIAQINAWKFAPGKYYDLEKRNCIHFVGEIARLIGLQVEYPSNMLRKPKRWLEHVAMLNPSLKNGSK